MDFIPLNPNILHIKNGSMVWTLTIGASVGTNDPKHDQIYYLTLKVLSNSVLHSGGLSGDMYEYRELGDAYN